jgi:alkanesulfonate monooxygenase SsuD/methylene tetrahydromethanopterin reductase-like flavin-dependent oxidoreductase (luciferase family)
VDYGIISLCDHLPALDGPSQTQGKRLSAIADQAVWAEDAGFDVFGVGEHHFSDYILPAPELLLSFAAARTNSIRLGTSVTLLAKRDPVRYAEAFAVLDLLTDGRAEATFARGVSDVTAQAFGIEHIDQLRPIFDEHLRLVLRLLTEDEVTWSGEHRSPLNAVRLQPRPIQNPSQAFWIGGGLSEVSADLAAELDLPFHLPSLFRWPSDYAEVANHYRAQSLARGGTPRVGFPSYLHVARTSQEAHARWRPHLDHYVDFALGTRSSFGRPTDFEALITGPAICGSPAEVAERVQAINETLGLDRHLFLMDVGALPEAALRDTIDLMGSEVLPALRHADP